MDRLAIRHERQKELRGYGKRVAAQVEELQAYKRTGYLPWEITEMEASYEKIKRETEPLIKARDEKRLLILPCTALIEQERKDMLEILTQRDRKAAKCHTCDYCGEVIQKGEMYDWAKLKFDGRLYEWKSHKKCSFITSELWSYVDPDNGMTSEDFDEGCTAFCRAFICPGCPSDDKEEGCREDKTYCTDKIYSLLQTHDFRRDPETPWVWRCAPKTKEGEAVNIEEAIEHAREVAEGCPAEDRQCAYQHDELADWLEELKAYRATGLTPEEIQAHISAKWIYNSVDQDDQDLGQKIEAVEKALGFKLFVWQKAFIARGQFRQMGATTAEILKDLLDVSALPIDYSEPERNSAERFYRRELRGIKSKLDKAGIHIRTVFFSKKDKWEYFADKKEGK